MDFKFVTPDQYDGGGDPWGYFLGVEKRNRAKLLVTRTPGRPWDPFGPFDAQDFDKQMEEEEAFVEWCTEQVINAGFTRCEMEPWGGPYDSKVHEYLDRRHFEAIVAPKRIAEVNGRAAAVICWYGTDVDRTVVNWWLSDDMENHRSQSRLFLDDVGLHLMQHQPERYLMTERIRSIDIDALLDDDARLAIMCGEHDANESHHFFMTHP